MLASFRRLSTSKVGTGIMVVILLLILVGYFLYAGAAWAVVTGIVLAGLSAIANFFFIPYYPFWSIVLIALDVWVIWALTRPGVVVARA